MHRFSVSDARSALACPRIFYFDEQRFRAAPPGGYKRVTRIWSGAAGPSACGKLFHDTVEKMQRTLAADEDVRAAFSAANSQAIARRIDSLFLELKRFINTRCLNHALLNARSLEQKLGFIGALDHYLRELCTALAYALEDKPPSEVLTEFFGDQRKRVDISIRFGPADPPIWIRGALDYIYFDWRKERERIVDYKLMPSDVAGRDLLQVSLYALMHHQQHQTRADVAVYYLFPTPTMTGLIWNDVYAQRHKVYNLLASMAEWAEYDEAGQVGLKPPGEPSLCKACPWKKECELRLGTKAEGGRSQKWRDPIESASALPVLEKHVPPESPPSEEFEDVEEDGPEGPPPNAAPTVIPSLQKQPAGQPPPAVSPPVEPPASDPAVSRRGLYLGKLVGGNQPVHLPLAALPTHLTVVGAAGSGKTYLAKTIAEEAIRSGLPLLAIDPQGDLVQFLRSSTLPPDAPEELRELQREFLAKVEVRIFTPGSSHAIRLSLSPLRLPRPEDLRGCDTAQRREEEWQTLLGVTAANLTELAQASGDRDCQQTFILQVLRALTARQAGDVRLTLNDIIAAIAAPDALGIEDPDLYLSKSQREKLKQKLASKLHGPSAVLFQGGQSLDIDRMIRPTQPGKTPLNVIYLNALADDEQKRYFVAALAAEVYRWMMTAESAPGAKLLFYLDEAKDYIPAGTAQPPAKQPLLRLFAQGRKFGVACLICTQSPRSVDYNIFSNASTKLIGRLEAAQDVERVGEWFSAAGVPPWLAGRKGVDNKSFVGRWPEMSAAEEGVAFRGRQLFTLHESAWSPERLEREWRESPHSTKLPE